MKKLLFLTLFLFLSFSVFSQKHYFSTDDSLISKQFGVKEEYIFPAEYSIYYFNDTRDTLKLLTVQWATILINDEYGYYQLLFFHDSGVIEVYEWEYKKIEWRGNNNILSLVSKDFFGVEIAVLSMWEDGEYSHIALLTSNKKMNDKLLYYYKFKNRSVY